MGFLPLRQVRNHLGIGRKHTRTARSRLLLAQLPEPISAQVEFPPQRGERALPTPMGNRRKVDAATNSWFRESSAAASPQSR